MEESVSLAYPQALARQERSLQCFSIGEFLTRSATTDTSLTCGACGLRSLNSDKCVLFSLIQSVYDAFLLGISLDKIRTENRAEQRYLASSRYSCTAQLSSPADVDFASAFNLADDVFYTLKVLHGLMHFAPVYDSVDIV